MDERAYDELPDDEQAVRRAELPAQMDALREELDLTREFAEAGRTYVGLDEDGQIVRYNPDGTVDAVLGRIES